MQIHCGEFYNIILNDRNELSVCGDNCFGQLGVGDNIIRSSYEILKHKFGKITQIRGNWQSIILNSRNEIFTCGDNSCGQMGFGDNIDRNTHEMLKHNFGKIIQICCGGNYNIILNDKHDLFVCGNNSFGQLGLKDYIDRNIYTKITDNYNFGNIVQICSGFSHNIILNSRNELFLCGNNEFGQLGFGDIVTRNFYVKLNHKFGKIVQIHCGFFHNIILNDKNELFVCGRNCEGQLGFGDNFDRNKFKKLKHNFGTILQIRTNSYFNIILNNNNELFVCGRNTYGQLGLGHNNEQNSYIKLEHTMNKIKEIKCGMIHNLILTEKDGQNELFTCGINIQEPNEKNIHTNNYIHDRIDTDFIKKKSSLMLSCFCL